MPKSIKLLINNSIRYYLQIFLNAHFYKVFEEMDFHFISFLSLFLLVIFSVVGITCYLSGITVPCLILWSFMNRDQPISQMKIHYTNTCTHHTDVRTNSPRQWLYLNSHLILLTWVTSVTLIYLITYNASVKGQIWNSAELFWHKTYL